MKRPFAASVIKDGNGYASQYLEIDIAALELYFWPPQATRPPKMRLIEIEVGAA